MLKRLKISSILICLVLLGSCANACAERNRPHILPAKPASASYSYNNGLLLSPPNTLFLLSEFKPAVCRKPLWLPSDSEKMKIPPFEDFRLQNFYESNTVNLGSDFLQINGANVYKDGNSVLLIPRSFIMPKDAFSYILKPKLTIKKAD